MHLIAKHKKHPESVEAARDAAKWIFGDGAYRAERLHDHYELGRKLGAGQFGVTYECKDRGTGEKLACKTIPKARLVTVEDVNDVRNEVAIMFHMAGHPNIVAIRGCHEDEDAIHIVMELCLGGELYDEIIARMEQTAGAPFSERDAAAVAKTILRIVSYCHSLGVIHRDLKPENFLLSSTAPNAALKLTDFGLSTFYKPGDVVERHCGSPMYMAPEVVRLRFHGFIHKKQPYGPEVDIWSAGVILYALLCGYPPFYARSHSTKDIFKAILQGNPSFEHEPWPSISEDAKGLVRWMLQPEPHQRPTAHQVLSHRWVNEPGVAPDAPLDPVVAVRLREFSGMVKMKRIAMQVIALNLREEEIQGLKEIFMAMDTDRSGTITLEELMAGLQKFGAHLSLDEILRIMQECDLDQSGEIEYAEFLAATMNLVKLEKQENLLCAFAHFDRDGSGYVTAEELREACAELHINKLCMEAVISEADSNHDGKVDYNEFVAMMRKNNGGVNRRDFDIHCLQDDDVHRILPPGAPLPETSTPIRS